MVLLCVFTNCQTASYFLGMNSEFNLKPSGRSTCPLFGPAGPIKTTEKAISMLEQLTLNQHAIMCRLKIKGKDPFQKSSWVSCGKPIKIYNS